MSSLAEKFNEKYGNHSISFQDDCTRHNRPTERGSSELFSRREQTIYRIEELLGVETGVWDKSRAHLSNSDLDLILESLCDVLDVSPAEIQDWQEQERSEGGSQ